MGIFLVAINRKYGFSSNTNVLQSKNALGFRNSIDRGHANAKLILTNMFTLLQILSDIG